MNIRKLTEADVKLQNEVSSSAFIWCVDEKIDTSLPEGADVYGAFTDGGDLAASIECLSLKNYFGGSVLSCAGVGGVASKPEHRRLGAVRGLFDFLFDIAPEKGYDISILYPFSNAYYGKFGYAPLFHNVSAVADFSALSDIPRFGDVVLYREGMEDEILALYNRLAKNKSLMFSRSAGTYFNAKPYEKCEYTYLCRGKNGYSGYVSYTVSREKSLLSVSEIMFDGADTLRSLLGFLRCYDGNIKKICFNKLPLSSPVFYTVSDEKIFERVYSNGGAARILNLQNVLNAHIYPTQHGAFTLYSTDTAGENGGYFTVEYENGTAEVTRKESGTAELTLTPSAAAELILSGEGFTREKLSYLRGAEITGDVSDVIRAFPYNPAEFYDGY